MSGELVPVGKSLETLAAIIAALAQRLRTTGTVRRAEMERLRDEISFAQRRAKMDHHAMLVILGFEQMMTLHRRIDDGALSGEPLALAMEQLRLLVENNRRIVDGYAHG